MLKLQNKADQKWGEGQSSMVVNMAQSQNKDQLVKASEVDNVRYAVRDYLVKAWTACQYTGLCPHGARLNKSTEINLLYFRLFINIFPIMQQLVRCIYFIHSHKNLCY